ncbi:unnamed protein product, partial [marine sediment metagenome]
NLDRVLYFAQYVVTHVDEEAREKELKRQEDKIALTEHEQAAKLNARIAEARAISEKRLEELSQSRIEIDNQYDEMIAERLEPTIKAGQRLEGMLSESLGEESRTPIQFPDSDQVIAKAGEIITNQHLSEVQEFVKLRLEEIEDELKEEKEKKHEEIRIEIEEIRAETDLNIEDLRNQHEDQSSADREENIRLRDELVDLQPLTFIGESRYRDLRARWGQVFQADMGAEAFFNILKRLDLDKLSEELWHEVRTSRSKQKRSKATKRLKVVEAFRRSGNRPEWMILTVL